MREKELRLALVCFGGVSLAVYMHGISKEILKLVRASSALHGIRDRGARLRAGFFDHADRNDPEFDTENIYFELLREIGRKVEMRVVVDIIAGASAGGINGAMLARALAHDLPMRPLRDLWLEKADVSELLDPAARAHWWNKLVLSPFIWTFAASGLLEPIKDAEARRKLSLFLRSRWFKPPLDGTRMSELMYDAIASMGGPRHARSSLLPSGQRLDLFVTLTDYHGYQQLVRIHDPALIHEREHRHLLRFSYQRRPGGEIESDFDLAHAPALAFAARATSSFPGAFPPAQIAEMDRLLARRRVAWPGRTDFLARSFARYAQANVDPVTTSFIDGSVLDNKPFREAIQAIRGRPAYRQVDRRLVYIEPDPAHPAAPVSRGGPGFFATLRGALSDIPRNQPIADDLSWVNAFNERVRRLKAIITAARPQITALVIAAIDAPMDRAFTADQLRKWRQRMNTKAAQDAGFAFEGYVRLKLAAGLTYASQLIAALRGSPPESPHALAIAQVIEAWAAEAGVQYESSIGRTFDPETAASPDLPRWSRFLLAFDLDYRKRRLHFLIEGQNRLYQMLDGEANLVGLDPATVDRLKREYYHLLEALRLKEHPDFFTAETRELAQAIFAVPPSAAQTRNLRRYAADFAARHGERIDRLIDRLAAEIDLDATTGELDRLLAAIDVEHWPAAGRREVLVNYLGFAFWDVLTFSVTTWRDVGEFDEVLIDRISPADIRLLRQFGGPESLKGVGLAHFAAFLSRAYRENDYLIGRLHGADRMIDIVCDAAGFDPGGRDIDIVGLKRRAFTQILDAEEKALPNSVELIAQLRRAIQEIGAPAAATVRG